MSKVRRLGTTATTGMPTPTRSSPNPRSMSRPSPTSTPTSSCPPRNACETARGLSARVRRGSPKWAVPSVTETGAGEYETGPVQPAGTAKRIVADACTWPAAEKIWPNYQTSPRWASLASFLRPRARCHGGRVMARARTTAKKGDLLALKHGAYRPAEAFAPRTEEILEQLHVDAPYLKPADMFGLTAT